MDSNSLFQTVATLPSEISGSVPRRIRLSESSRLLPFVLVSLIGLTFVAGLVYGKHVVHQMRERSDLRQDGVEAQGKITFLDRVGRGGYVIRYTFTADGGEVSDKAEVPPELVTNLEGSTATTIRYLPSNPAINHPAAWEWSLSSEWPAIFVLAGLLTVGAITSAVFYRQRNVLVWGKPVPGIVTKCWESGRGSITVNYEFHTEAGMQIKGSGKSLSSEEIGARVWILYLPQNPTRNLPYPAPDYVVDL